MPDDLPQLALEHAVLVVSATLAAMALGIPLGLWLTRRASVERWVLGLASVVQTVPSLALLAILLAVPGLGGIGKRPAIVALVLYALLPILRNTVTGIAGVDPPVRESAVAMGMTGGQLLRLVELPLAAPTILAGVRIATVTTVGTATIAAAIGGGGLGVCIFRGLASVDIPQIFWGAVPAAAMALLADGALGWLEQCFSRR